MGRKSWAGGGGGGVCVCGGGDWLTMESCCYLIQFLWQIKKFMVGYEMLAQVQRDLTAEQVKSIKDQPTITIMTTDFLYTYSPHFYRQLQNCKRCQKNITSQLRKNNVKSQFIVVLIALL